MLEVIFIVMLTMDQFKPRPFDVSTQYISSFSSIVGTSLTDWLKSLLWTGNQPEIFDSLI
jgi:hypothetical protein